MSEDIRPSAHSVDSEEEGGGGTLGRGHSTCKGLEARQATRAVGQGPRDRCGLGSAEEGCSEGLTGRYEHVPHG